ncbi:hypothetical protein EVAR_46645_1 [Eumeta japonica]|uniref:Uncharacterized protein n=1 Tax=Eumeta variegata TaxID=151549 RepID=A0A4C1WG15_EUMVA|nr:hypothetical protein EVAR_46645_1 [Eumeta japonica]
MGFRSSENSDLRYFKQIKLNEWRDRRGRPPTRALSDAGRRNGTHISTNLGSYHVTALRHPYMTLWDLRVSTRTVAIRLSHPLLLLRRPRNRLLARLGLSRVTGPVLPDVPEA